MRALRKFLPEFDLNTTFRMHQLILAMLALILNSALLNNARAAHPHGPGLKSNSALIMDAATSEVLYARNPNNAAPIASITKLMTALVVLEGGQPLDELIEVSNADRIATVGAPSRLAVGAKLSRRDLLHLALMSSDNRAAYAVGRAYPGGLATFVSAMNAKANSLGMSQSKFVDPSGLGNNNRASASDLATLVLAAARQPIIREFSTDSSYALKVARQQLEFRNTNYLVNRSDWNIELQKTGFTNDAGQCLVMKTLIGGRHLVIVLLDSFGKYTRTADARRIKKWLESDQFAKQPPQRTANRSL